MPGAGLGRGERLQLLDVGLIVSVKRRTRDDDVAVSARGVQCHGADVPRRFSWGPGDAGGSA
jgi:hypothetical protein